MVCRWAVCELEKTYLDVLTHFISRADLKKYQAISHIANTWSLRSVVVTFHVFDLDVDPALRPNL